MKKSCIPQNDVHTSEDILTKMIKNSLNFFWVVYEEINNDVGNPENMTPSNCCLLLQGWVILCVLWLSCVVFITMSSLVTPYSTCIRHLHPCYHGRHVITHGIQRTVWRQTSPLNLHDHHRNFGSELGPISWHCLPWNSALISCQGP